MAAIITDNGADWLNRRVNNDVAWGSLYVGWGTGSTLPTKSSTSLSSEGPGARVVANVSHNGIKKLLITTPTPLKATANVTIKELGLFTSDGILIAVDSISQQVLSGDSISWTLEISYTN